MKIELEVSELKELLEQKTAPPMLVQDPPGHIHVGGIHELGDPRRYCHVEKPGDGLPGGGARWICTLPSGHSGDHAVVGQGDYAGKRIIWEGTP